MLYDKERSVLLKKHEFTITKSGKTVKITNYDIKFLHSFGMLNVKLIAFGLANP